jgi:adenosine deaminase
MRPTLRYIKALPKADLHSHIDGSVPPRELFEVARRHRRIIRTPAGTELGSVTAFMEYVEGNGYGSMLDNIVDRFHPITGLMQTESTLREVGVSYVKAQKADGVAYAEGRFAPQYHRREGLSLKEIISSMADGLAEGSERYGVKTSLIVGIGRESTPKLAVEVAKATARSGKAVALDLCGPEAGYPGRKFKEAFDIAAASGMKITIHAGEGAETLRQNLANMEDAITRLHANRLGHAVHLAESKRLTSLVLRKSVAIEMNPISNLVLGNIGSLGQLAIDRLLVYGVPVSLNSDDPALWPHGDLSEVYLEVCKAYGFGPKELDKLMENSFNTAFLPPREREWLIQQYRTARRGAEA